MKKKQLIILLLILVLPISIVSIYLATQLKSNRSVSYDYEADVLSVSGYDKVLRFAGGTDFSPFAYIDENGNPCGHDVELAFAIGRELGYKVEVTLGDWKEMQEGIIDGTYDVLITVDYSDERSKIMGYTSPVCLDSYVYFGKNTNIDVDDLKSLKKLKIAALKSGGATDNYLIPLGLYNNTTFYDNQIDAFKSVEDGINDIAIAGYIYGSNIIASNDIDLVQVGSPLYGTAYYFTYNINNTELGPSLNKALASLDAKGETTRISEKWTTHYQPNLTLSQYLNQNIKSFLIICMLVFVITIVIVEIALGKVRRRERLLLEKDQLTGLYNMHSFLKRMTNILTKNLDKNYILIRFDINNFKAYNNTQGTKAGDEVLKNIGNHINIDKSYNNEILLSGYLGADHFVLLIEKKDPIIQTKKIYNFLTFIAKDVCPNYLLSMKMGLCEIKDRDCDLSKYCDQALIALKTIKNDYYHGYAWFDEAIQLNIDSEKEIENKMFKALDEGRFVPYFQAQYDYESKKISGAEVLTRWIVEDGTLIQPSKFIPVFEKNGFIYEMDKAIWKKTCECISKWKKEGIMLPHLSINISRSDIYHSDLVETILDITKTYGISLKELHLEITESAYLENSKLLIDTIKKLKEKGAVIEMDDFGSGYSSLSSLKEINVDVLKIDMSLVKDNTLKGKDAAILETVVSLGLNMGLDLIAEGVEKEEQASYLHSLGCNKMQGYLYYKPVNQEMFEEILKKSIK